MKHFTFRGGPTGSQAGCNLNLIGRQADAAWLHSFVPELRTGLQLELWIMLLELASLPYLHRGTVHCLLAYCLVNPKNWSLWWKLGYSDEIASGLIFIRIVWACDRLIYDLLTLLDFLCFTILCDGIAIDVHAPLGLSKGCFQGRWRNFDAEDWVQCELCSVWYHCVCVGITFDMVAKKDFSFVCMYYWLVFVWTFYLLLLTWKTMRMCTML